MGCIFIYSWNVTMAAGKKEKKLLTKVNTKEKNQVLNYVFTTH